MEFPEVQKKQQIDFLGVNLKQCGTSSGDQKKNNMEFLEVLVSELNFPNDVT